MLPSEELLAQDVVTQSARRKTIWAGQDQQDEA